MPGPHDFIVGNAPAPASLASGLYDFQGSVGTATDQYYKNRAMNAFPNGIPTVGNVPLDKGGTPDYSAILSTVAKTGGAPAVQAILPYLYMSGITQSGPIDMSGNTGPGERAAPAAAAPPPVSQAGNYHPAGTSPDNIVPRQSRNEPPQKEMPHITGAGTDADPMIIPGDSRSYTHFQENQNFPNGTVFEITTPTGTYRGVKGDDTKLKPISPPVIPKPGEAPEAAAKRQLGERMHAQQSAEPTAAATATPQVVPRPGEQGIGIGGAAVPRSGTLPQGATPIAPAQARPPTDPAVGDPEILENERRAQNLEKWAASRPKTPLGNNQAEAAMAEAKARHETAKNRAEFLRKQVEETPEQKTARQQNMTPLELEAQKEIDKQNIIRSTKVYSGITGAAEQYERDTQPYLKVAQSLLNDPATYTGIGAEGKLQWDRIRANVGDAKAAQLEEALGKVRANIVLGQINQQKDQMTETGQQSGRIFAQQVELVEKAAPGLGLTLGGNRFLVESQSRLGEQASAVAKMARDYIDKHKYLDAKFDGQVAKYISEHPLFTKDEMRDPHLIGAVTIPPNMKGGQLTNWISKMGLKPGDPIRRSNGTYATVE